MRRRLLSLFLALCMVLGMLPVVALAVAGENRAPVPGDNIAIEMKLNDWYDLNLSEQFTDPDGDALVYEVSADGKTWTQANIDYDYYPAGTGTQKAYFRAVDSNGEVSEPLTLTATVAAPPSSVTVTLSISRGTDGFALCSATNTVMVPVKLTVPYFDLALYGLEEYYYSPLCYSTHKEGDTEYENSQIAGTRESAQNIVTLMHVFIYATERFYLGYDAKDCGKGLSYDNGSFETAISWTGSVGSSYMKLWEHGTNLNYYVDWEYPLGAHKWGSTSDQIVLYGGEKINGHMIATQGPNGTNFSYFTAGAELAPEHQSFETAVRKGAPLELTVVRAYEDYSNADSTTAFAPSAGRSLFYCKASNLTSSLKDSKWIKLEGETDQDGKFVVDTAGLEAGDYYVVAEGFVDGQKEVAPALIKVTVKEAPDAALEITQNGQRAEVKKTGIIYNDVNVYFAQLPAFAEYQVKDGLSNNGTRRQFAALDGSAQSCAALPAAIDNWQYESTKASIEAAYGAIEGLDDNSKRLQAFQVSSLNDRMQPDKLLYVLVVEMPVVHVSKMALSETAISMPGGESRQLIATVTPADTSFPAVTWTSSDPEVAEVTQDGIISGYTAGTAEITATADGVSASCTVTVTKSYPRPSVIFSGGNWPVEKATISKVTMHAAAATEIFQNGGNYYITLDPDLFGQPDKVRLTIDYREESGQLTIEIDDMQVVDAQRGGTFTYEHEVTLTDGKGAAKIEGINKKTTVVTRSLVFSTDGKFEIAPMLAGSASGTTVLFCGEAYKLNLEKIFRNTSVNPMTYTVSVNGREAVAYTEADGIAMNTAGSYTLKFVANNGCGDSPVYTVTAQVLNEASVQQINHPVQGGVLEWVAFTDENRRPLPEGTTYSWDAKTTTFTINLPTDYEKLGKVMTFYKLTKDDPNSKLPLITGSTLTAGAGTYWDSAVRNNQTDTLNNGDVNAYVYLYESTPSAAHNTYTTLRFNYQRVKPDTAFQYQVTGNASYTIAGDVGGVNGHSWMDKTEKYEVHIALTEDTPLDAQLACIDRRVSTTLTDGFGQYAWNTDNVFGTNPEHWVIQYKIDKFPHRIATVAATGTATVPALKPYELDLTTIFADPDAADTLTYEVKLDNGEWEHVETADYSYTPANADVYTLTFRAFDGFVYSEDTYTVTLTATNSDVYYDVTVRNLPGEATFFISKGFDINGNYIPGDELRTEYANGTHTVKVPMNVSRIAMEVGDAWITTTVYPEDAAKNTFAMQKTTFDVRDKVDRPAEGTVTLADSASNPLGGENNVFYLLPGETYSATATPTGDYTAGWTKGTGSYTVTTAAQNTVPVNLEVRSPKYITIDQGAELNVVYQNGYYVLKSVEPLFSKDNGDGTLTYTYSCPNGQYYANGYMYFAKNGDLIDKAGYMMDGNSYTITWEGETRGSDYRHTYDPNYGRGYCGDDSVMVNVTDRNHLVLDVGESYRLLAFRIWQIINTDTENVMIEPEFTYTNYDKSIISLESSNGILAEKGKECGTGGNNWMEMKALSSGTTFLEVGYEAIHMVTGNESGSWGGATGSIDNDIYNACDPARTALVVVQTDGNAAEDVSFGIRCYSSNKDAAAYDPLCAVPWDAEFDTVYFTGDHGQLEFSPSASSGIKNVAVSYNKGRSFRTLAHEEGVYTMDVYSGNNIIRVTNGNGQTAYQVVRGDKISYSITNVKDANKNGITDPGDTVRVRLNGLHFPVGKMSGIYNPGYSYGIKLTYDDFNGAYAQSSNTPQYSFVTESYIDVVIDPDYQGDQYLRNGYINFNVFGDVPGNHRNLGENGRPVNTSASSNKYTRSILPDILVYDVDNLVRIDENIQHGTITADRKDAKSGETITLTAKADDYYKLASVTVTDAEGKDVPVENMTFTMPENDVTVTAEFISVGQGCVIGGEELTAADADLIYAYINGTKTFTNTQIALADVNGDGYVDTTDAALVYRLVNGTLEAVPTNGKEGE